MKSIKFLLKIIIGIALLWLVVIVGIFLFALLQTIGIPLLAIISVIAIVYLIFFLTHHKPLTYSQIVKLANRYAKKYIKDHYTFVNTKIESDAYLRKSINGNYYWYSMNEPLATFPSLAASLLNGTHHEWIIYAIEKDNKIIMMWTNMGNIGPYASSICDIAQIIQKCRELGGYAILRFQNRPNSNLSLLPLAGEESQSVDASLMNQQGINWLDFMCSNGKFKETYHSYSETFQVDGYSISDFVDITAITPSMDFSLQRTYWRFGKTIRNIILGIVLLFILLIIIVLI